MKETYELVGAFALGIGSGMLDERGFRDRQRG
jgi:hypothetical protein